MLNDFELFMPTDFNEACALKANGAKPVAGGTDVYVNMHGGKKEADQVVDIKNLAELKGTSYTAGQGLVLGALTSHRQIEEWDVIKKNYYAMFQGCSQVGSVQIRYRATLGGNIMNGAPSADSIGPMLVHDAVCVVKGPNGERKIPLDKFYTGFKKFDIQPDELLARIEIPDTPANAGSAYYKYMRRGAMDLALMGVSAYVELDENDVMSHVRIALTTAGPTPMRSYSAEAVLEGQKYSDEIIIAAAEAVASEGKPRSSWRSSAEFRVRLLHDVTIMVLHEAVKRAKAEDKAQPIKQVLYKGQQGLEERPKVQG
ncbi:MAG: FAD binding domain-containing protein [Lachnospiraceae bacterium]|nr:FAD binding domain-containing protein [Candidatus Equihabitans merdae]